MVKKRKHQFHCQYCGSGCEIYKKGKGHRVLVCPNCGVLASNPLPLLAAALPLAGKLLKGAGKVVGLGGKDKDKTVTPAQTIIKDEKERYDYKEFLLKEALYGGRRDGNN